MAICATCLVSFQTTAFCPTSILAVTCWPQCATTQTELHGRADKDAHCVIL